MESAAGVGYGGDHGSALFRQHCGARVVVCCSGECSWDAREFHHTVCAWRCCEYREGIGGREVRILDGYRGLHYQRGHWIIVPCSRFDKWLAAGTLNTARTLPGRTRVARLY